MFDYLTGMIAMRPGGDRGGVETFVDVVQRHVEQRAVRTAYTFLADGDGDGESLTYAELDGRARVLASVLSERGAFGRPVLILCPAGLDYPVALLACFYAGAIAVPAYPPTRVSLARTLPRVLAMQQDCRAQMAIATAAVRDLLSAGGEQHHALARLQFIAVDEPAARPQPPPRVAPAIVNARTPALLQYTSGSTARPKGVLVTHEQILANHEMSRVSGAMSADDVFLSWLPPYHDMGLIGGILMPLYLGARAVLMPPDAFIRRPKRWFTAAQRHRATILMAPNFAFDLCVRRVPPEERAELDLSGWRLVYNGAEPIHAGTLDVFGEAFRASGFRRECFYPCYGMAEATLIISGGTPGSEPVVRAYLSDELERHRAVRSPREAGGDDAARDSTRLRRLVGCGRALLDERILIVDPEQRRALPPGNVGEIWVQSRSLASGYHGQPELTAETFQAYTSDTRDGPFLRTGDLGFFDQGELFITGRVKDLIIVRGLNHYPQDIERSVQAVHPALVAGGGAAFALDSSGGEQLVVVQELDKRGGADADALLSAIAEAVRDQHDLAAAAVVLIKRGSLPKTSSGKIQRRAAKAAFLSGSLEVVARWPARPSRPAHGLGADRHADQRSPEVAEDAEANRLAVRRRERLIADWLTQQLSKKLRLAPDEIDPHEPLARYGVDSLLAAELTEDLERWLGSEVPATITYDNPSIAELSRALASPSARAARPRRPTPELLARSADPGDDAFAIVGMGCRFPGAPDIASFWALLRDGRDAISEVPKERWDIDALYAPEPGTPGKMCSRYGGFIRGIDGFDAPFFGVSQREAAGMDPQQRLFLEVAWEALEDAGQAPSELAGSDAGVFAGVCTSDYALLYGGDLHMIDGDYGTGAAPSIVANRVSYVLDLKGPSETIDSACSSGLVALQRACQSMRNRECDLAIVGGVNAVLAPESNVYFSQLRALARDGRCKAFDARADGLVRSEGAGVVVLKRLSRALADGDRIYALVLGSAVNHDGRSNGLTGPSGNAQREVVRRAMASARVRAADLDYVEAHGVGTKVADTVEMRSLGALMAERPRDRPLLVGSAKTNVGHLEAASGIVGLIKVALALQHEQIPPHLHLREVHPDIGISALPLAIPTELRPWQRGVRPRIAGVSAFGFGGTNAHVIVSEPPLPRTLRKQAERPLHVLTLSAKTAAALRAQAQRLSGHLGTGAVSVADVCYTANTGRSHFGHRLALVCGGADELARKLAEFARNPRAAGVHAGEVKPGGARLRLGFAFLETQVLPGAGRALFDAHPPFRRSLERCSELLRPHLHRPLLDLLYGDPCDEQARWLRQPSLGHPALVALQCSVHAVYRDLGIEPNVVYGAGAGEYAAAAACGAMAWEQALVLTARRGQLLEGLSPGAQQRLSVRKLRAELAGQAYAAPAVPFVSASLGRAFAADEIPADGHWGHHLYHAPRPDDAQAALVAERCDLYLEIGPPANPAALPSAGAFLPSLAHGEDALAHWLDTLALLYTRGAAPDWRALDAPFARSKLALPTYPFERTRCWLDFPERALRPSEPAVIEQPSPHPLFGRVRVHVAGGSGFIRKPNASDIGNGSTG